MATIRREIIINAGPESVWSAVRDVGAVHHRLVPGLVTDCRLEEGARIVTFASGKTLRELIVDIDDANRRLVYAAVGGLASHHNSSMQVFADGPSRSRLVWITDVLPNEIASRVGALVDQGSQIIQRTLENNPHAAH